MYVCISTARDSKQSLTLHGQCVEMGVLMLTTLQVGGMGLAPPLTTNTGLVVEQETVSCTIPVYTYLYDAIGPVEFLWEREREREEETLLRVWGTLFP